MAERGDSDAETVEPRRPSRELLVAVSIAGVAVVLLAILIGYRTFYSGRVYPGVTAGGVSLSGLNYVGVDNAVADQLPGISGPLNLRDPVDGRRWAYSPQELGVETSPTDVAELAMAAGRTGELAGLADIFEPIAILISGQEVLQEGATIDEQVARATLVDLAPEVDVAPVNADLRLVNGELVGRDPQLGRQLDVDGTVAALVEHAGTPTSGDMDLVVRQTAPRVGDPTGVRLAYEKTVSAPVHVVWEDTVDEVIDVGQLAEWANIENAENEAGVSVPTIVFDYDSMRKWVTPLADTINRTSEDARFAYDANTGEVSVVSPGRSGITLDVEGTMTRIVEAAYSDDRVAQPEVVLSRPHVSADNLPQIRQVERMVQASSSIRGAPESRLRNILLALERFNGVAMAPGQQFSFNQMLGDLGSEPGYDLAVVELGGAGLPLGSDTAPEVGPSEQLGGIDQLAALAFRCAYWAGLPIVERHAPAARSGWLEPPVGLDAAVDGAQRDLRFTNDTEGYLLIQAGLDSAKAAVIWTLYGVPDGRGVASQGPTVSDVEPALGTVVGVDDQRLPPGERQQARWAREGGTSEIERTVTRNGAVLSQEKFVSDYSPSADVVVTGAAE